MAQSSGISWSKDSSAQDIVQIVGHAGKSAFVTGESAGLERNPRALSAVRADRSAQFAHANQGASHEAWLPRI